MGTVDGPERERGAVLILEPAQAGAPWELVELSAPPEFFHGAENGASFPEPAAALHRAYDLLTLMSEGRVPEMHEHVQQSVREFVRELEQRGYDREAALKLLMDVADRQGSLPPKAPHPTRRKAI